MISPESNPIRRLVRRVGQVVGLGRFSTPSDLTPDEPLQVSTSTRLDSSGGLLGRRVGRRGAFGGVALFAAALAATASGEKPAAAAHLPEAAKAATDRVNAGRGTGTGVQQDSLNPTDGAGDPPTVPGVESPGEITAVDPGAGKDQSTEPQRLTTENTAITAKEPIWDRAYGSREEDAYQRARNIFQGLIKNGKEAGGAFQAAAEWLEARNKVVIDNVTRGVPATGRTKGYGSTLTLAVHNSDDIRDRIVSDPGNLIYPELRDGSLVVIRKMVEIPQLPNGIVQRYWVIFNADHSPQEDSDELVRFIQVVETIKGLDEEMIKAIKVGAQDISSVDNHLQDPKVLQGIKLRVRNIAFRALDELARADKGGRWPMSSQTDAELQEYRRLKSEGKI